ncbi:MAG: ketopantoate reductase family protein [Acidimicrobiia bacterium]
MRLAVVGAGGVGGYFGGRLSNAGHEVVVVARGSHLEAIGEAGLRVRSIFGDFTAHPPVSDEPADFGPCDAVLFSVKSFDTEQAVGRIAPLIGPDTVVVSLQNGIDNEEKIAAALGESHVAGGAAFIFSSIVEPGLIAHTGGPARLLFGEMNGDRTPRIERLLDACRAAGIDSDIPSNIHTVLWTKFAFICATAGMTAAVRLPLGDIRASADSWAMFRCILEEVVSVARAEDVPFPDGLVEEQIEFALSLPTDAYSSLHHDLVEGRRMELDALHGTLVRRAAKHGIPVPANEAIFAILRPWEQRNSDRIGEFGV